MQRSAQRNAIQHLFGVPALAGRNAAKADLSANRRNTPGGRLPQSPRLSDPERGYKEPDDHDDGDPQFSSHTGCCPYHRSEGAFPSSEQFFSGYQFSKEHSEHRPQDQAGQAKCQSDDGPDDATNSPIFGRAKLFGADRSTDEIDDGANGR